MKNLLPLFLLLIIGSRSAALDPAHFTISRITAPYFIVDGNSPTTLTKAYVGFEVKNNSNSATTYSGLVFTVTSIGTSVVNQNYTILSPVNNQVLVGTLAPGESKTCYFYVQYPASVAPIASFNVKLNDQTATNKTMVFSIYNRSSISANAGGAATQSFVNQDIIGGIITDDVTYAVGNAQLNDEVDFQVSVSSLFDPGKMSLLSTSVTSSTVPGINIGVTDSLYFKTGNGSNGQTVTVRWTFRIIGINFSSYVLPCAGATSGNTNYKYTLNTSLGANGTPVTISSTANPLTIAKTSNKTTYDFCEAATFTLTISNPGLYGVTIDSIKDQLPTGFTYTGISAGSGVSATNSTSYPASGTTGNLVFSGGVTTAGITSYFIPAGGTLQLIYTAVAPCSAASNLSTTASGYIGAFQFANSVNTVNVNSSVLPLTWLSFDAKQQVNDVLLSWSTINEQNNRSFIVQHSISGSTWTDIGIVNAKGNGNIAQQYSFKHLKPNFGTNLYRLLQTDQDGKTSYSKLIKIISESKQRSFIVLSNPVVNGVLKITIDQPTAIHLMNAAGQIIFRKQLLTAGLQQVNIGALPPGIYSLLNGNAVQKIVIQ